MSQRIRGFDGLRAIAFLLVFVSHKWIMPVTDRLGSVAVWIFFVLSGFLITRILAGHRSRVEAGRASHYEALADFYRSRVFRIFPPYYAVLAVLTALAAAGLYNLGAAGRQWADLLFYSNIYIEQHGWRGELGHLWSLAVEQQYYLVFAPLVLFTPRARLPALCVALVAVSVVAHIFFLVRGAPQVTFDVNSFINIGLFGIGGLAGLFADRPLPRWLLNDVSIVVVFILFLTIVSLPVPVFSEYGRLAARLGCLPSHSDCAASERWCRQGFGIRAHSRARNGQLCGLPLSPDDPLRGSSGVVRNSRTGAASVDDGDGSRNYGRFGDCVLENFGGAVDAPWPPSQNKAPE